MLCRPSPFFVLDEVDAALDNANVKHVADFLHSTSREGAEHGFQSIVSPARPARRRLDAYNICDRQRGLATALPDAAAWRRHGAPKRTDRERHAAFAAARHARARRHSARARARARATQSLQQLPATLHGQAARRISPHAAESAIVIA